MSFIIKIVRFCQNFYPIKIFQIPNSPNWGKQIPSSRDLTFFTPTQTWKAKTRDQFFKGHCLERTIVLQHTQSAIFSWWIDRATPEPLPQPQFTLGTLIPHARMPRIRCPITTTVPFNQTWCPPFNPITKAARSTVMKMINFCGIMIIVLFVLPIPTVIPPLYPPAKHPLEKLLCPLLPPLHPRRAIRPPLTPFWWKPQRRMWWIPRLWAPHRNLWHLWKVRLN